MNIPETVIEITDTSAILTDLDGHRIEATKYKNGLWALLNEFSSKPERPYHFTLRKQFADNLNGHIR